MTWVDIVGILGFIIGMGFICYCGYIVYSWMKVFINIALMLFGVMPEEDKKDTNINTK